MKWITRDRPKIDRLACMWLIRTRIDPDAQWLFAGGDAILDTAAAVDATPFGVPGAELAPRGKEARTFDAFLAKYNLDDPALHRLARIVRGADTGDFDLAPEAAGLRAILFGLPHAYPDDHALAEAGLPIYAGLYEWCSRTPDRSGIGSASG